MNKPASNTARVIANYGARLLIKDDTNTLKRCVALKKLGLCVTGDMVEWAPEKTGDHRVTKILPRTSLLQRPDRTGKLKPIAANLTHLLIVAAVKPGVEALLIDQYAAAAELAGIEPLIVINKSDLLNDEERRSLESLLSVYAALDYETVFINTQDEFGIKPLSDKIGNKISMLVGQSGVGKSSIVSKLFPDLDIQVGALSEASGSGSHTTTVSSWYELEDDGALIDSPGVRQFSLEHFSQKDLALGFREITETAADCKYNNCTHLHEPQCAVRNAVGSGTIDSARFANYRKLVLNDLPGVG